MAGATIIRFVASSSPSRCVHGDALVIDLADTRAFGRALRLTDAIKRTLAVAHLRVDLGRDGGRAA